MLLKTLTTIKSHTFDSEAIKSLFYFGTAELTYENVIFGESITEAKNI